MADKTDQDTITAVGPGADEDDLPESAQTPEEGHVAGEDYDYPEGESDADGRGDERTGHAETDEEGDRRPPLTKEQRRRQRKRERHEREQRELNFLRARNEQLEREHSRRMAEIEHRQTQSDVLAIDGRIAQAESDVREAETLFQQAMDQKDSAAATEALRVRDQLREGLNQLKGTKQRAIQQAQARQQASSRPTPSAPSARAQEWIQENPWFNPQQPNEDTLIAQVIEDQLFREGRLNQNSDEYWEELDRRLARRLPERYETREDDDGEDRDPEPVRRNGNPKNGATRRSGGPTFKVGGRERPLKKGEVYIDEDRKQAMIEKGVWDDPVLRERQLKYYQQYDRDAGRRPR